MWRATYNGSLSESQCYKPSGTYGVGVDSTDNVTAATVITGGSGYTSAPTCAIAGPTNNQPYKSPTGSTLWAGGTQATCTATVSSSSTTAVWTIKMSDPPFTDWVSGVSGFTVGGTTYTFFTSLTGVTTPNAVLMVSSSSNSTQETDAAKNLEAAINDNSSQCVTAPCFANITAANTYAIATESTSTVTLTAKTAGYAGNFNAVWENGFLLGPELVTITNTTKGQGPNYVSGITVGTGVNAGSGYQPETPITLTGVGSGAIAIANTSISTGAQSYQPSYGAAPGYDMATGLGSPNAYNLVFASAWIKPQTITFTTNAPSSAAYNSQFTVAATASSGLTVAFTSSGSCTNSGATYTMTSGAGSCSVIANQAGDGAYAAAPTVTQTVSATPAPQTITFTTNAPSSAAYNSHFTVAATSGSGLTVAFTSSGSCTNSVATYTVTSGSGSCSVIANQSGNTNYSAAPTVTQTVNATPASQSISFTLSSTGTYGGSVPLTATATSGLPVTYHVVSGPGSITNNSPVVVEGGRPEIGCSNVVKGVRPNGVGCGYTLSFTGTGQVVVEADQTGNGNYGAATAVQQTVNVGQAPLTVNVNPASFTYGGTLPTFTGNLVTLVNGDTVGTTITVTYSTTVLANANAGTYSGAITATVTGSSAGNYVTPTVNPGTLTITPATLTATCAGGSFTQGGTVPAFAITITGIVLPVSNPGPAVVHPDRPTGITSSCGLAPGLSNESTPGNYPTGIVPTVAGIPLTNYTVVNVDGDLTINPAAPARLPGRNK
jgi:hypothetical protein